MARIWLNGEVVEEEDARIPVLDRAVLYGDGIFETLRAYDGFPFRLERHLRRLKEACDVLRLEQPWEDREIAEAIRLLYRENVGSGDAYVRITLTGGLYDGGRNLTRSNPPNLFVVVTPLPRPKDHSRREGIRVCFASFTRNSRSPLVRIKSANYLESLWARQEAADRGYDDALFMNEKGHLCEATTSNLFLVKSGELLTPEPSCGLLPGITREAVLELCRDLSIPAREGELVPEDLLGADEAFLTNSVSEILPLREVEGKALSASPGPLTSTISRAYRELVERETAPGRHRPQQKRWPGQGA